VIVVHVALTAADDYATRRETHRRAHLERIQGLRAAGIVIGGGPAPDGRTAEIVYRLQQPAQITPAVEEDPYWMGGVWTGYVPRSFAAFVEPWELPPVVLDGSRRVTVVEGSVADLGMAQLALVELRGAGRVAFGGFFEGGQTWALARTAEAATALDWFQVTGLWTTGGLTARPLLHVL